MFVTGGIVTNFLFTSVAWWRMESAEQKKWSWIFLALQLWPQLRAFQVRGWQKINKIIVILNTLPGDLAACERRPQGIQREGCLGPGGAQLGVQLGSLAITWCSCLPGQSLSWVHQVQAWSWGRSPKTFSIGFSAGLSPILVKISVNCLNWWELRWRNCHQIWWHFGWRFCHLLFHPIWWFFWGTAWNGEN